jgi:peptidyl-prolyl cis-trans isomerase B (cyclophilin B)
MRPKDLIIATVIVAVIVIAGASLVLNSGGDDKDNFKSTQGVATTTSSAATAPTLPAPAATSPAAAAPAATQAPAPAAPPATPAGEPSCTGPTLASLKRGTTKSWPKAPDRVIDPAKSYTALIKTSKGDITATLAAKDAPITVNSFIFLSCNGFYDGLNFHRVVKSPQPFVIQGGDPKGDGSGGPGYQYQQETSPNLKHDSAGVLSMANAGPGTNGSQFFITLAATPSLDGGYNVFGKVTDGMSVVNNIAVGDKITSISIREN